MFFKNQTGLQEKGALRRNSINCPFFFCDHRKLSDLYIDCSRALPPLLYVKGNPVAFIERLETDRLDP